VAAGALDTHACEVRHRSVTTARACCFVSNARVFWDVAPSYAEYVDVSFGRDATGRELPLRNVFALAGRADERYAIESYVALALEDADDAFGAHVAANAVAPDAADDAGE
jgi:hypothetical protein